ncbi:hypothetical protein Javan252_0031 [Streptococcus phage Javan252]|nr:hypothetical protein Javan252_0031 [Streptococcus phage Javan252]
MITTSDYEDLSDLFCLLKADADTGYYSELMQSTGLFDKNGVEIFEGDIIVAMSQGVKAIGEVKRRIDGYWLMYPALQHGELWHIVENVDTGETGVEVVGNIYENPELVEVENE